MRALILLLAGLCAWHPGDAQSPGSIHLVRVPGGGVQPDVAVEDDGRVHMVYLAGDPAAADVFYVTSADGGRTFSPPIRVNSQPGSAIALGTIRGAQVAFGRDGRVHVAWNGSDRAEPRAPANPKTGRPGSPMLYARSDMERTRFEPQRNMIAASTNLDGGGSIATDRRGGVYVAWHGNGLSGGEEDSRRVWITRSVDDGATFTREVAVSDASTGACACCAVRIFAEPGGYLRLLYRSATANVHRDVYALLSRDRGRTFGGERLHAWEVAACPMSSMSLAGGPPTVQAWETEGQVYFNRVGTTDRIVSPPASPDVPLRRKHPRVAVSPDGSVMLAWAEGTGWSRGGSVGWQMFRRDGQPTADTGIQPGLPAWSFPAVIPRPDGGFTIVY